VGTKILLSDLSIISFDPNAHDVSTFDCGDSDLNDFLQNDASDYQSEHLSFTSVVFYEKELVGYITLLTDSIVLKTPEKKKLVDFHSSVMQWPALKIGRLAVATARQKECGIGKALLQYAVALAIRIGLESGIGCRFLTVDAYPVSIGFYERHGFVVNKNYVDKENPKTHPSMRYDILKSAPIQ
jgi:ribosomal protein S18 acetylase RimI-like enzyme